MWEQLDLLPAWPSPASLTPQLKDKTLTPAQRSGLVQHAVARACLFADMPLLSFLLHDPLSKDLVDLKVQDEDGLGVVSQSIIGFGEESDRDVDREECIRLLIAEGAPVDVPDFVGWTPLHHAALRAPPTLVVHLLMHSASPLATSQKHLTPLDVITGYQPVPNRQDVALLLAEAMREQGWQGTPLEIRRQARNRRRLAKTAEKVKRVGEWDRMGRVLGMGESWWAGVYQLDEDEEDEDAPMNGERDEDLAADEIAPEEIYTPPRDYTNMLVFSLSSLPSILQSIIVDADPLIYPASRRSAPANAIYLLARFACIHCDASWFDAVLTASVDRIEEVVYARPDRHEDMAHLAFWLYNSTLLLHLLKCDQDLYDMCESLDLFSLMEELINAIYVFIIRGAEKRIDPLIDGALLEHSPLESEFESIQFESDWSFFRSLTAPRRKQSSAGAVPHPPLSNMFEPPSSSKHLPSSLAPPLPSPLHSTASSPPASSSAKAFSSLRQTIGRASQPSASSAFPPTSPNYPHSPNSPLPPSTSPASITAVLTSIHTLLTLYTINPAIIIQAHSQVMYWISCEVFNRMLTRKKLLCRSRAMQISLNLSVLEEWIGSVGLPSGVVGHFAGVRELLSWLQCHSSIDQFLSLVDTIQTMRTLNPLQMRRAVRDYRYEVNESKMSEECVQYLAQLQKDWERRRVKMGVEALRKEIGERRDRADSVTSGRYTPPDTSSASVLSTDTSSDPPPHTNGSSPPRNSTNTSLEEPQRSIDALFDRDRLKNEWSAPKPPSVLGELLDSTYMLPLLLPRDADMLAAWPGTSSIAELLAQEDEARAKRRTSADLSVDDGRSASRASVGNRGAMQWRLRSETVRHVEPDLVDWVDGGVRVRLEEPSSPVDEDEEEGGESQHLDPPLMESFTSGPQYLLATPARLKSTPSQRRRLERRAGRESSGGDTIVPDDYASRASVTPERPRTNV